MRAHVWIASICLGAAACSPAENQITPIYVAPQQFQSLSCDEMAANAQSLAGSAAMIAGAPAVGSRAGPKVVVWPDLSTVSGEEKKSALGRLKGEFDALVITSSQKGCGIDFQQGGT